MVCDIPYLVEGCDREDDDDCSGLRSKGSLSSPSVSMREGCSDALAAVCFAAFKGGF